MRPVENKYVAALTLGEGWHNWHHAFPYDYAASEFGDFAQFNPTKFFLDSMAMIGMVTDRKRALDVWEKEKAKGGRKKLAAGEMEVTANRSFGG